MGGKKDKDEGYPPIQRPNVAGLVIGRDSHFLAYPREGEIKIKEFSSVTDSLLKMATFLRDNNILAVALEALPVYWVPVYRILKEAGLELCLVLPGEIKHPPGRKKGYFRCQLVQKLYSCGLLKPFAPSLDEIELSSMAEYRVELIQENARYLQEMAKALLGLNIRLGQTLIASEAGVRVIKSIVNGERNTLVLADLIDPGCEQNAVEMAFDFTSRRAVDSLVELKRAYKQYIYNKGEILVFEKKILYEIKEIISNKKHKKKSVDPGSLEIPDSIEGLSFDEALKKFCRDKVLNFMIGHEIGN
ncbi:MAG: hypothetical protein LBR11_02810 [Deltaproteobacteria bacterium]|jgi:hypothetical protein|nr:hypothetical protein [Deltaproteobacteria bacterium]